MNFIKKIITLILLLQLAESQAQSGYDKIKFNDFIGARNIFLQTLQNDSLNYEALTGMIIISEITQDYISFEKNINVLLRNYNDPYIFSLFNFLYNGDFKAIEKKNFPDWITVKYKISEVISWGDKNRDRQKQWEKYGEIIPKANWAMIGPFKNIYGSAFIEQHPIETEKFDLNKAYKNDYAIELKWATPKNTAASGRIIFTQHLPNMGYSNDGVYYANTFIKTENDKKVKIKIGRTSPLKIWINDKLVFQNNHSVPFTYDIEEIEADMKKGYNRILIKNATQRNQDETSGSLYFWDGNSYEHDMLAIRFCDENGKPLKNLISDYTAENYNKDVESTVKSNSLVDYFKRITENSAGNVWNEYCLLKSFLNENYIKQGEEYFYNKYALNKNMIFYGYLYAKMCQFNNKSEKVYEVLSKADEEKTPIFGILFDKLQEINIDIEPEKYYIALQKLSKISPSNLSVINNYINYYNKIGKQTEKDTFIYQTIRKYSKYKETLEPKLSNYNEKRDRYGITEQLKEQKKSIKALKTGSADNDFDNAITYYKDKKKKNKVFELYRDKIYFSPHITENYNDFAEYLKENEKYEEAKQMLSTSIEINPYQTKVYTLLGDIAKIEGKTDMAVLYYQKGANLGSEYSFFGYSNESKEKLEQIVGSPNYKKLFKTPAFDETLQNPGWYSLADNEDAIVLQYTKNCVYDTTNSITMYQTFMVKILKESGIEKYNEFDMSFLGDITSAKIISEDGTISNPERSGSYIVIKNLKPGDLIEVEGQAKTDAGTIFGKEFYHQHFIFFPSPVFYSEFEFVVPKFKKLVYKSHKIPGNPEIFVDSQQNQHYKWINKNLEKITEEVAMPDYWDLYRSISVSTIQNWEPVNDWYYQTTYQKNDLTYEVKLILDTLINNKMSDSIKIQKIYNFITSKIRYSYVAFLNSRFVPKWPGNTVSAGIGDCKDVATLMITMLRSQGIEAYYTLVKTNQYNHLETIPSMSFDHVIVCYVLNGKKNYCDLTTNFYPLNVLPEMDNSAVALLVKKGEKDVFKLPNDLINSEKTLAKYIINAEFEEDKNLKLKVNAQYIGNAGGNLREQIFRTHKNKYDDFVSNYFGQDILENSIYNKVNFINLEDFSNPLKAEFEITAKGFADKVSGLYILRMPYLEAIRKNQAIIDKNRTNRIDLEKVLNIYASEQIINLKIPTAYKLAEMPQNISYISKYSMYNVQFKLQNGTLQIIKNQKFFKSIIELNEVEEFKVEYQKLLDLDKFKIALIKNNK
ncbi:MAG: hypothetical protein HUU47_01725 [Bacteroidetes bacterium]|nr:hypothetical protein [Bacteroidota bacterium]